MSVNIKKISTESRNQNTLDIDKVSTLEIVSKINHEDMQVAYQIEKVLPSIAKVIDVVYEAFINGGRLIYMGAGTSGRIGILDAVECPPTYGVGYDMVMCLMAGGNDAFVKAKEGAEDDEQAAIFDLKNISLTKEDVVIGIAASGRTPYVLSGIKYANLVGCNTSCITTSLNSPLEEVAKYPIVCVTGAEVITGSTRMKSGTAQKMICNMISTSAMIKMGKVYENLMIDLKSTNEKLIARSYNIICEIVHCEKEEAIRLLQQFKTIKRVIFNYKTKIDDLDLIDKYLNKHHGNIQKAIEEALGK